MSGLTFPGKAELLWSKWRIKTKRNEIEKIIPVFPKTIVFPIELGSLPVLTYSTENNRSWLVYVCWVPAHAIQDENISYGCFLVA